MENYLMETAAHLGISDKVIFAGFVRGIDKQNLFRIADVFIMPSISEPFGIVPLESLANSTPVIISKQSGISEILMNSLKVDFWDVNEITNKVVAVLKHKALKQELGTNGNLEVSKFTWDSAADSIVSVYDSLI
jgi:glycosyltransferase involved in cell wall biosynthesis